MAMSESAVVRELNRLKQKVDRIERGQRYAHGGSIENSALEVRDDGGSLRAIVGQQADGTTGINVTNGPTPPVPSDPTVEPALAALTVTWDGTFADDIAAPLDWMRCEVHIGPDALFTPDQGTLRDTIESPQGGSVVVPLPYTEWHVKLRSRTTSGVASDATAAVAGTPRQAESADITAGSIVAEHIAVDAITGKTITGGTVTGSVVQTAATGERITINEADSNSLRVYDSTGRLIGLLSEAGLRMLGTSNGEIHVDPNSNFPRIRFYSLDGTNEGWINAGGADNSDVQLNLVSGMFTGSGFSDIRWFTNCNRNSWFAARARSSNAQRIGGQVELQENFATIGYANAPASVATNLNIFTDYANFEGGRFRIFPAVDAVNSAFYVQTPTGYGGPLMRAVNDGTQQFVVQANGDTTAAGVLTAGNMAAGRVSITPAANTPTSMSVTGLDVKGSDHFGYATALSGVPGTTVQEVSVSGVSSTGITVWLYRTNTTTTSVYWQVIGAA